MTIEAARQGFAFATVRPARRSQLPSADRQPHLHRRGRPARLHRADQYPRQYAHARLCDPARVRRLRRRSLQPRSDQSRRTALEESQLLQGREDQTEPGSAPDRVVINVVVEEQSTGEFSVGRRLFDRRRLHGRGQCRRAQPARPRPLRQGLGAIWPACQRLAALVRRALSSRLPAGARHRPVPTHADRRPISSPTIPGRPAAPCGSASPCARICRSSCAIRSTARRSVCRSPCRIATTSIRTFSTPSRRQPH